MNYCQTLPTFVEGVQENAVTEPQYFKKRQLRICKFLTTPTTALTFLQGTHLETISNARLQKTWQSEWVLKHCITTINIPK